MFRTTALLLSFLTAPALPAADWIFRQGSNGQSTYPTYGGAEAADDFTLNATVEKVRVYGYLPGQTLTTFQGVRIRFYNNASGLPGAVAADYTVPAGDPGIIFTNAGLAVFEVTLPAPFNAAGTYFLSVQILGESWSWFSSAAAGLSGQTRVLSGAWQAYPYGFAFDLFGTITGAGQITGLSAPSVPKSGYFEVLGQNFGNSGRVLVNGISAPVATWSATRVIAYVPEAAAAGAALVQVDNGIALSNSFPLTVTNRVPNGRIRWTLQMDSSYATGDPAVAADGTLYLVDVSGRLYAIAADGGLKWIVRVAGNRGPSVGPDGTVYVGDEQFVRAFNPDGSLKWTYTQPVRAFFLLDIAVGPDGNIYGVATQGLGTFSLTPAGTLRWAVPEPYNRPIADRGDIVFGPNGAKQQLYFYTNAHTLAYDLAGNLVNNTMAAAQPRVSPSDASVHIRNQAYAPNGALVWTASQLSLLTSWNLGQDGTHYGVDGQFSTLWAITPGGTPAWSLPFSTSEYYTFLGANRQNSMVVLSGTVFPATFLKGVSIPLHSESWRVDLPVDAASGASQSVQTNPVFSPDGATTYVTTTVSGVARAYLIAVDATGLSLNTPPTAQASATPTSGTAPLAVAFSAAGSRDLDGTITSYSWNFGDGTTGSGATVNHTYTAAGTYDARLTVTDNFGATGSATVRITVTAASLVLRSTAVTLSASRNGNTVIATGRVTVRDSAGAAVANAAVSATWRKPDGSIVSQTAATSTSGVATFTTTGGRGTYTLTVTNIVKTGYTFDTAGSVLTGSVTR